MELCVVERGRLERVGRAGRTRFRCGHTVRLSETGPFSVHASVVTDWHGAGSVAASAQAAERVRGWLPRLLVPTAGGPERPVRGRP